MKKILFTLLLAFVAFTSNAQLVQFTVSAGDTTQINQSVIYKVFPTSTGTNVMFLNKTSDFQTLKTITSADSVFFVGATNLLYLADSSLIVNKLFITRIEAINDSTSLIYYNNGRKSEVIKDNRGVTTY